MSRLEGFSYVGDKAPGARRRCAGQPATRSPQPATRPTDREREKPATTSNTASNTATTPSTTTLQSIDRSTRHTNLDQSIFFIIQVPSCSSFNIGYDETENGQGEGQQKEDSPNDTATSTMEELTVRRSPPSKFEEDMMALDALESSSSSKANSQSPPTEFLKEAPVPSWTTSGTESSSSSSGDLDDDNDSSQQPIMIASSSSSSSSSSGTLIADSWDQADAVVETILWNSTNEGPNGSSNSSSSSGYQYLQQHASRRSSRRASSSGGPLSWFCAPLDFLPTCEADPATATACGEGTSAIACTATTPMDPNTAYQRHVLRMPFTCSGILPGPQPHWTGHLPLDPVPEFYYRYPCLKNKRRHRIPTLVPGSNSTEADENQSLDNQEEVQQHALFAPSLSLEEEALAAALSLEEAATPPPPPAASSAKKDTTHQKPKVVNSGSIPAVTSGAQPTKGRSPEPSTRHKGGVVETVQVQTPGADRTALKELPALRDAAPAKREELFILKLKLCSVIFSFDDPTADKRGKDMKRQTLLELVDYVNTPAGQKVFTESVMGDLMAMISANVCRALPPATDDFDPEEDEPVLEPAWPHLQVAYEFFLRFIVSSEVNAKAAKKYVDQKFCLQLVELFDSEDPRERDYLKTILHRIYGKFMSHRSFIRRAISNVFYRFVYETERHNGIGELLEILGSIINGFAIPLKKEHLQFLVRALIPLHKPKCVALYHQQLSYCIIQYVEKDADTATPILNGFFKCWPWSCSGKQVMFLNELEEILELLGADQLAQVSNMLFTNLARCLDSDHFQVVERALFLWNNEHLVNSGCLSRLNAQAVLPIIYGPLYKNSSGHWNATVEGLAQNVLKMYMEYDLVLYDKCTAAYFREEEEAKRKLQAIQDRWSAIEKIASTSSPAITVK